MVLLGVVVKVDGVRRPGGAPHREHEEVTPVTPLNSLETPVISGGNAVVEKTLKSTQVAAAKAELSQQPKVSKNEASGANLKRQGMIGQPQTHGQGSH